MAEQAGGDAHWTARRTSRKSRLRAGIKCREATTEKQSSNSEATGALGCSKWPSGLYRSPLHCATALLESASLQLPPTELGCVPALPLSESPPLPLTAIPIPTRTISSLGQMPLLPLAFSQGTVPLAPLLPSSVQILRTLPSVAQKGLTGTEDCNYHFFTWDTSLVLMRPTSSHSLGSRIL